MTERFSETEVAQALASLSDKGRLAFALSCSERLYPNYLAFKRKSGWGDPTALRRALDMAWAALEGARPSAKSIALAREQVQAAEPETEDFDTILVSSALDAAASAGLVLRFIEEGGLATLIEIVSLCRDTVDMFIQDRDGLVPSDPNLEDRIHLHPLMQAELHRQYHDLSQLQFFSGAEPEVSRLRQKWRNPKTSNIEQIGSSDTEE